VKKTTYKLNNSKAKWKIYAIPGLGFDHRIFEKLRLTNAEICYCDWIEPLASENIVDYATRFSREMIADKNVVLMSQSFGGILAQEIAKIKEINHLILISTVQSNGEMPLGFKNLARFKLYKLITRQSILATFPFWQKAYGYHSAEDQSLFKSMAAKNSNNYFHWAINQLGSWKGAVKNENQNIIRIHGDNDKTFPIKQMCKVDYLIEKGGHFAVYQKPDEVSGLINKQLNLWQSNG